MIRSYQFREVLESLAQRAHRHPLVAVFQPILIGNEKTLEKHAGEYYNQIKNSGLAEPPKSTLLEVFVNWLEQRLKHKGKKEIEKMLLGDLPDLRDTQSGKDLIQIGKIEGKQEDLIMQLKAKFGTLAPDIRQRIEQLTSADKLEDLLLQLLQVESIDQLNW